MTDQEYEIIQSTIHYYFSNKALLDQAFTRKSYVQRNIDAIDNEVMEFYGDKVLSFILVKEFAECLGQVHTGQFFTPETEGTLTSRLVEFVKNSNLIQCIEKSGLYNYVKKSENDPLSGKAKGDLFEAILGAVAIDSNWNINQLTNVVDAILNPKETLKNQKVNFSNGDFDTILRELCAANNFECSTVAVTKKIDGNSERYDSKLLIKNGDFKKSFKQNAMSEKGAVLAISRKAYIYAKLIWLKEPVEFWIINPAIQLQYLRDSKLVKSFIYKDEESSENNHSNLQKWNCTCTVIDKYGKSFTNTASGTSIKDAHKNTVGQLLPVICQNLKFCQNLKKGNGLLRLIEENYDFWINQ